MIINLESISPYIIFLLPPLVGAFIGYLTNRIAIRMLFRPLKPWKILGLRLPMTPGVIPSKRHELAVNIGDMVGQHLLTSKEVGSALKKEKFQSHLYSLIQSRMGGFFNREIGPLETLVPRKFKKLYASSIESFLGKVKNGLNNFIQTDDFETKIRQSVGSAYENFLERDIESLMDGQQRQVNFSKLEHSLKNMLKSEFFEKHVNDIITNKKDDIISNKKSCEDIFPPRFINLTLDLVDSQTPALIDTFAEVIRDPQVQEKIVIGMRNGVENFVASMGPMSAMVQNFLSMDTVEEKVREYLHEKEEDIVTWLKNEEMQKRISTSTRERLHQLLVTPVSDLLVDDNSIQLDSIIDSLSSQILRVLRDEKTIHDAATLLMANMETYLEGGTKKIGTVIIDLFGDEGVDSSKERVVEEAVALLRKEKTKVAIGELVESFVSSLLKRPIGKLSDLLPPEMEESVYRTVRNIASSLLANEIPGLVDSLNIKKVITEKVDSLDLLRLERLLLSIMEEQFKYINLFGALLGFIIGMINSILITIV